MHVYIYDLYTNKKKYDSVLAKIETRITDLGLNGKIVKMGPISSLKETVENEIKRGAKTIIVVGGAQTLNQTINILSILSHTNPLYKNIPIGFIPVGKQNNPLSDCLGIQPEIMACDVLAARRIKKLDLGIANNILFLSQASITTLGTIIEIDNSYSIENITEEGKIFIINLPNIHSQPTQIKINPQDGVLELYIQTKQGNLLSFRPNVNHSVFTFTSLKISNPKHPLIIDYLTTVATPVEIKMAKEKINLIVGKNRSF